MWRPSLFDGQPKADAAAAARKAGGSTLGECADTIGANQGLALLPTRGEARRQGDGALKGQWSEYILYLLIIV